MLIIEKILGDIQTIDIEGAEVDKVLLDHYDMAKPHQKLKTESGETIALSLPHGENLFAGAVLYKNDGKLIYVDLQPEDALVIYPEGNTQWAKAAFNVGNMHQPAYLYDDCIAVPYDAIIENLIKGIGVRYERSMKKLDGHRAGVVVGGRSHHHHYE